MPLYAIIYNIPYSILPPIIIGLGVILFILSILSNMRRSSPPKIGAVNRYEYYSAIVVLIGILLYLYGSMETMNGRIDATNVRIDEIYQLLLTMK